MLLIFWGDIRKLAYETEIGNYGLMIFIAIYYALGGYPEANYRIARIPYFVQYLLLEDGTVKRKVHNWKKITTASPPHFITKHGVFYIDKDNSARSKGRPAWFYHMGKSLPIPVNTGQFQTPGYNLDPITIKRAYRTDIERRLRSISQGRIRFGWIWWILALLVVGGVIYYLVY